MFAKLTRTTVLSAFAFLIALQLPAPAYADVTVTDRELVSQRRVSRFEFLYTYRLVLDNPGTTLEDVRVYVSCDAPGTTLVDDIVEFGDIPEQQSVTSTGTFSLRQDRRIPFDPDCLLYEVGFETVLRISGQVTDMPLPGAEVTLIVIHPDSGRPIIESGRPIIEEYTTTADDQGNYSIEVDAVTEDDFIQLEASGTGEQSEAELTSSVGEVGTLHEQGSSGSIVITNQDNGAVDVTHITTAQDELVRRLNNGVLPTNDGDLSALRSQVNGAELLNMASVIKTIVDNANIPLPPGVSNTRELIQNPGLFQDTLTDLQTNFPDEFNQAVAETADQLNIGFSPDTLPATLYVANNDETPLFTSLGYVFRFEPNGLGSVILFNGDSETTWEINDDGEIVVQLLDPPVLEFIDFRDPPGTQVRILQSTVQITLIKLTDGLTQDQVFALERRRTNFPDDPIPDEFEDDSPSPDLVYLSFGADGILASSFDELAGTQVAAYYYHTDNDTPGLSVRELGADMLAFDEDGTGIAGRRQFEFDWIVDDDGIVEIEFFNGDVTRFVRFREGSGVSRGLYVGTFANGESRVTSLEAVDPDGLSVFTEDTLNDRRYSALWAILEDDPEELNVWDFLFLEGGDGCRISGNSMGLFALDLDWTALPGGFMDSLLFNPGVPDPTQRRSWQAIAAVPGIEGDRYWVIENLEIDDFDPNTPFTEPAVTPGRINAYEFIEDLTGQFDPCGTGSSFSLTTLFDSNNGAVGNMFDIDTFSSDVLITGVDVNVGFPVGTDFEISVFTVPGPFEDTITAPSTCTLNCAFDVSQWTLAATGTGTAAGQEQPSFVDIDDIPLDADTITGFWITLARDGSIVDEFRYTNIPGTAEAQDDNIVIVLGAGVTGQAGAEGVVRNRAWNGTIYYDTR